MESLPILESTNVVICSLHKDRTQLPIEDHWKIKKMWSMDKRIAVSKAITPDNAMGISDISFKQHRGLIACILDANTNIQSRIYDVHDTLGNQTDQYQYQLGLRGISMMLVLI